MTMNTEYTGRGQRWFRGDKRCSAAEEIVGCPVAQFEDRAPALYPARDALRRGEEMAGGVDSGDAAMIDGDGAYGGSRVDGVAIASAR